MTPSQVDPRERYLAEYRRFTADGGADAPPWLAGLRSAGMEHFTAAGFPTTKLEDWRFTDLTSLARMAFERAGADLVPDATPDAVEELLGTAAGPRLVFVNGYYKPGLSLTADLPRGVRMASLAAAIRDGVIPVEQHLGRYARPDRGPFAALNAAFAHDGAVVHVPRGVVVEQPLRLLFLSAGGAGARMSHPRNLIILEPQSTAIIVEMYASLDGGQYLTNAVTEFVAGDGARGRHYRIQTEGARSYHLASSQSYQGRDSRLDWCTVAMGSALSRHEVNAVLGGAGAFLNLNGLSVLGDRQHVDHHTTIDHAQPHCESHELFNGIYDEAARGVFNGRIVVRPGAQRTDSKQTNNNVLLSDDARADSQPQLEIYADDVKCTHGATSGPLDPNAVFYLQSRGVDAAAARQLLTYGFGADILSRIDVPQVRERLDRMVRARLAS